MHICLLTWAKYPVMDLDTREISRVLAEKGFNVEVIMRSNRIKYYHGSSEKQSIHYLPSITKNELIDAIFFNVYAFFLILKINRRLSIDVIQNMNFGAWLSSILSRIFLGIPLLYNIRAPNVEFYFPLWMPFNLLLIKMSEKIFCISSAYRIFLNIQYGIPLSKIEAIPMGADASLFSPQLNGYDVRRKYDISFDDKVLIYVGTLSKERRLEILLRAVKTVRNELPAVRFLIVGDGDGKASLLSISEELGLKNTVIFTGYIDSKLVPFYIAAADVAISAIPNTLYYSLSSPTKIFEYMAMGKPVIASNIFPHAQIINNGVNGLLVKWDEPEEYTQAIIGLLGNNPKAKEIGSNAMKDALTKYDWKIILLPMTNYLINLENKTRLNRKHR